MIEIKNVKYSFQGAAVPAVDDLNFIVKPGEIFGLLGPNGAGKSTLIHILTTMLTPDSGSIRMNGMELKLEQMLIRRNIGVVFQDSSLDERLTAYENMYFHAKLYHVASRNRKEWIGEALRLVNLWERRNDFVSSFSGGMKRRLELSRAIVHRPKMLILDEPTIGLDPQSRRNIWDYVKKAGEEQNTTVLLTTHYLEEAEICHRIAVIDHGKIIALDTPENLKKLVGGDIITLRTENNEAVRQIIQNGLKIQVSLEEDQLRIQVANGNAFLAKLFDTVGNKIIAVDIKKPALEDVFIKLTGREIREEKYNASEYRKNTVKSRWIR